MSGYKLRFLNKRSLLMVALLFCVCMMPMSEARAEEESGNTQATIIYVSDEQQLLDAMQFSGEIKLLQDITVSSADLEATMEGSLDLNGKTLAMEKKHIIVTNTFKLKDSGENGKISGNINSSPTADRYLIKVGKSDNNVGNLTIESGSYEVNSTLIYILKVDGGIGNITDGTFSKGGNYVTNGGTLNMSGGTINSATTAIKVDGADDDGNQTVLNLSGGEVVSSSAPVIYNEGVANISGSASVASTIKSKTSKMGAVRNRSNAKLVLSGGRISGGNTRGVSNEDQSSFELNGGEVFSESGYGVYNVKNFSISGGSVKSTDSYALYNGKAAVANINGGLLESNNYFTVADLGKIVISGGEIKFNNSEDTVGYPAVYVNAGSSGVMEMTGGIISSNSPKSGSLVVSIHSENNVNITGGKIQANGGGTAV